VEIYVYNIEEVYFTMMKTVHLDCIIGVGGFQFFDIDLLTYSVYYLTVLLLAL